MSSITDERREAPEPTGQGSEGVPVTGGQAAPRPEGRPFWRRRTFAAAALVVVAAVAAGLVGWAGFGRAPQLPPRGAPVGLPASLLGLSPAPARLDFAAQPAWLASAREAAGGASVAGRSYGSVQARRQIRVVAGRADLTGRLEFAWAADPGREVRAAGGTARCTNRLRLTASTPARERPTTLMCWRTLPGLSAYAFLVDFDHAPTDADGARALDAVWSSASR